MTFSGLGKVWNEKPYRVWNVEKILTVMGKFQLFRAEYFYFDIYKCISITEADAIHISMHSQWYDTLKIHMKQLVMRFDSPVTMQCDSISIRFNTMRFDAMEKFGSLLFLWFRQTANHKLTYVFWLLMPRGLFHKTSLPNRPGLFHLVWLTVKWFGSIKQI